MEKGRLFCGEQPPVSVKPSRDLDYRAYLPPHMRLSNVRGGWLKQSLVESLLGFGWHQPTRPASVFVETNLPHLLRLVMIQTGWDHPDNI